MNTSNRKTAPDLDALPAGVPPRVRRLLGRCLQKDPKQRLHDMADARIELAEEENVGPVAPSVAPPRRSAALVPWAVAALAIAAAAAWALLGGRSGPATRPALKLAVLSPTGTVSSGPIDISPDGRQIVFTATGADGQTRLYVGGVVDLEARVLPGGEGADPRAQDPGQANPAVPSPVQPGAGMIPSPPMPSFPSSPFAPQPQPFPQVPAGPAALAPVTGQPAGPEK